MIGITCFMFLFWCSHTIDKLLPANIHYDVKAPIGGNISVNLENY